MTNKQLHTTLFEPDKPVNVSPQAQWLSGEGAGSWFLIEKENEEYVITRFSPAGKTECKGKFILQTGNDFNIQTHYKFTYISHCSKVNIIQNEIKYQFKLKEKCKV